MFFLSQSCNVTLRNAFTQKEISDGNFEIAQLFPSYDKVTLSNNCILTCRQQSNGHGGMLALRAKTMNIDGTSKILTTGKGMLWKLLRRFHEINICPSHPCIQRSIDLFIHAFIHLSIHSFIHSSTRPLVHSSISPFVHSLIHSFTTTITITITITNIIHLFSFS